MRSYLPQSATILCRANEAHSEHFESRVRFIHESKVDFTDDLTMDFSGNNYSWGIFANAASQVTAKTASINMQGGNSHAIWLKDNASVAIAEALKTNAHYAMVGQGESTIDVQKDFITTARSGLSVQDKAKIFINSSGRGKVQFSGFTEMDDKSEGQIVLNVGSGSVDENFTGTSLIAQPSPILQWLRRHHSISF